ncbi:MAG: hypothetical protein QNK31_04290 [Porticoccus sp.]|nr:hypothetical protein [Porticoccus sp.]
MKYQYILLTLVSTLGLFSCSSQSALDSNLSESFVPEINDRDLKQFTYKVSDLSSKRGSMPAYRQKEVDRGTKSLDETRKNRNLGTVTKRREQEMLSLLDKKLAKTVFCQEGYTIISRNFQSGYSEIKGQCKETATQQDKENFPAGVSKNTTIKPSATNNENFILNLPN